MTTKIVVFGGAGFIGSNLVSHLINVHRDINLIVVDGLTYAGNLNYLKDYGNQFSFLRCDIRNRIEVNEIFNKIDFDILVNLAAESHVDNSLENPNLFLETNILGLSNLMLETRKIRKNIKFIHISTDEVYGSLAENFYAKETYDLLPNSPYSASKAAGDLLLRAANESYGFKSIILRFTNNFGIRQHKEKYIPNSIIRLLKNENISIYGDGKNIREWLSVQDCVEAISLVIFSDLTEGIFNIGSGEYLSNNDVAKIILEKFGYGLEKIQYTKDRPGHDFRYALNSEKFYSLFNWRPKRNFRNEIKEIIDWYSKIYA